MTPTTGEVGGSERRSPGTAAELLQRPWRSGPDEAVHDDRGLAAVSDGFLRPLRRGAGGVMFKSFFPNADTRNSAAGHELVGGCRRTRGASGGHGRTGKEANLEPKSHWERFQSRRGKRLRPVVQSRRATHQAASRPGSSLSTARQQESARGSKRSRRSYTRAVMSSCRTTAEICAGHQGFSPRTRQRSS